MALAHPLQRKLVWSDARRGNRVQFLAEHGRNALALNSTGGPLGPKAVLPSDLQEGISCPTNRVRLPSARVDGVLTQACETYTEADIPTIIEHSSEAETFAIAPIRTDY